MTSSNAEEPVRAIVKPVTCPNCSKPNPPDAKWCWVCYGELVGKSTPYAEVVEPQPQDDQSARRAQRRLNRSRVLNAVLGSLAAVLVACVAFMMLIASVVISFAISILEMCSPPGG